MGRRAWASVLAACLLLAAAAFERAWAPASPPGAGVQVSSVGAPAPSGAAPGEVPSPPAAPVTADPAPPLAPPPAAPPAALEIPALGVRAAVDPVGVEPDGSMTIPREGARVGWYSYGPAPGAGAGSAVLAGHVDTRAGGPGALFRLAELEPGDEIVVTDATGRRQVFSVVGREVFTKTVLPVERLFARDGPHRLTVITCGGPFDSERRSYRDNVVVVAVPVAGAG